MMKLLPEEKTDLRTELSKILFFVIFIPPIVFSQIPFKGFCKIDSFPTDSGYTKIFSLNFNQDEYADLLLYNPSLKQAALFEGKSGLNFELKKNLLFHSQPAKFEPIILSNNLVDGYAVTSRRDKSFSIINFNANGSYKTFNSIRFNSYPENVSASDIDGDGYTEFLISGNSFDGLTLLSYRNNQFEINNLIKNKSFQNAHLVDINLDGFKDILAASSVDNALIFYYNNGRNEFSEVRRILVDDDILSVNIFDLDFDSVQDIVVGTKSYLKIYYGDETISYNRNISIKASSAVNDFVIGDFNRDGYFDFNYLSFTSGKVVTIFAKDYYSFHPELLHLNDTGIKDVIPFFSKFVYGSAFVNEKGEFSILSSIQLLSDNHNLALATNPSKVFVFDLNENGIKDLAFIDDDYKLNFLTRNSAGVPDKFYTVSLSDKHSEIVVYDNSKTRKTFFCYSQGKRAIEYLEVDFEKFSFRRNYLYSKGGIENLSVRKDDQNNPEIFVLFSNNNSLNVEVFTKTTLKFGSRIIDNISFNWRSPVLISPKEFSIGYFSEGNAVITFNIASQKGGRYQYKTIQELPKKIFGQEGVQKFFGKNFKNGFVSMVCSENYFHILNGDEKRYQYYIKENKFGLRITTKNQLFFDENYSIFINDLKSKTLFKLKLMKSNNKYLFEKLIDNISVSNFTITNLDQRHQHIIYTSNDNSFINIRQLP